VVVVLVTPAVITIETNQMVKVGLHQTQAVTMVLVESFGLSLVATSLLVRVLRFKQTAQMVTKLIQTLLDRVLVVEQFMQHILAH